tara:strand:- start:365 stop:1372 length:1008 start_codon:yes stop_codon:yes gene_type:complete
MISTKYIFLIFRNNYRKSTIGNFGKSNTYGNIKLVSLSGRIKSIFGRILYFMKLGKFISVDGDPFLKNEKNSINIWFSGTSLKVKKRFHNLKNNYVNMNNPIIEKEKKIFQILPIIPGGNQIKKNRKIIFMGKIFFQPQNGDFLCQEELNDCKDILLNDFSLIDNLDFWKKFKKNNSDDVKFENYRILKTYLREKVIFEINKNFKNNFLVYGQSIKDSDIKFLSPIFNLDKIKKIYEGNLCIDTGSITGSLSLHPRSIQILESGGLLLQTEQFDSKNTWDNLYEKIISNNLEKILSDLDNFLSNTKKCNDTLMLIENKFRDSKKHIGETLKKIFY